MRGVANAFVHSVLIAAFAIASTRTVLGQEFRPAPNYTYVESPAVVYESYRPVVTYVPAVAEPITALSLVTTYRPVTTYYSPVTTYYAPQVVYGPVVEGVVVAPTYGAYSPVVTYAPVRAYRPVVIRPKVYVRGQPVRNFFRAITP